MKIRTSKNAIFRVVVLLTASGPAWAQAPADTVRRASRSAPAVAPRWTAELLARGVSAETVLREEEELNGSGYVLRARGSYRILGGDGELRLRGGSSYYAYVDPERHDRWSNELFAEWQRPLSERLTLDVDAGVNTNLATLEVRSADQASALTQFTYRPSQAHRYRISGAYRYRTYDDEQRGEAHAPYIGASYRHRFARYQYLDLGARHEWIDAELDRHDYRRVLGSAFYTHPLTARSRVRMGATARTWEYPHRLFQEGNARRDYSVSPQVIYTYDFRSPWRLDTELRWTNRTSNAPDVDRSGYRAALTLRYVR